MRIKILLALLIILSVSVGVFYLYKNNFAHEDESTIIFYNNPAPSKKDISKLPVVNMRRIPASLIYSDNEYGFQLSMPEDWKGYSVANVTISGNDTGPVNLFFDLPISLDLGDTSGWAHMFGISVFAKSKYYAFPKDLREQGWLDESPGRYIIEDEKYVFTWKGAQEIPDMYRKSFEEVPAIIKTFKFNK